MKPIFTIKVPMSDDSTTLEAMTTDLEKKLYDYHVIVVADDVEEITFQCFNCGCGCQIKQT